MSETTTTEATPGRRRRDRERWATIRVPRSLKRRIEALCDEWTQRHSEGRTATVAVSDKTDRVTPYALVERAIADLERKRRRSARSRSAK